ncbi:hypothetical protein ACFFX0_29010 [Citricoccus parietis]|uniref:Uncharacterized protein n=1 Tax=Citricoccus parietis TaxID=592307 RepID=A0ABV5G7U9_9MICC
MDPHGSPIPAGPGSGASWTNALTGTQPQAATTSLNSMGISPAAPTTQCRPERPRTTGGPAAR